MADLARSAFTNQIRTISIGAASPVPVGPTVAASQAAATQIYQMQFPSDLPKYYFTMATIAWNQAANTNLIVNTTASLALPLPNELVDSQSVRWNQANMLAEVFSAGGKILGGLAAMAAARALSMSVAAAVVGSASVAEGLGQATGDYLRVTQGIAPNQFITVLFESPEYKQWQFSWTLAANNPQEAEQIRQIIAWLNNNQAPSLGTGTTVLGKSVGAGLYWNFPSVFLLSFVPNSDYLFKFKPAVLTNFVVDYAGGHAPAFFRADSGTNAGGGASQNAPVSVTFHMQFLAIEYYKSGDYVTNAQLAAGGGNG